MMQWYWWLLLGWVLSGLIALYMDIRDHPAMQENIGWAEVWPVIFGPLWLIVKVGQWSLPSKE
jgi:hypothetical protein